MARTTSPGPGTGSGNSCSSSFRSKKDDAAHMDEPFRQLSPLYAWAVDEPGSDVLDCESEI
jgi:hypothetical protein